MRAIYYIWYTCPHIVLSTTFKQQLGKLSDSTVSLCLYKNTTWLIFSISILPLIFAISSYVRYYALKCFILHPTWIMEFLSSVIICLVFISTNLSIENLLQFHSKKLRIRHIELINIKRINHTYWWYFLPLRKNAVYYFLNLSWKGSCITPKKHTFLFVLPFISYHSIRTKIFAHHSLTAIYS